MGCRRKVRWGYRALGLALSGLFTSLLWPGAVFADESDRSPEKVGKEESRPTVTLTALVDNPETLLAIPFEASFSEPVTGFRREDVVALEGIGPRGRIFGLEGHGDRYTFYVARSFFVEFTLQVVDSAAYSESGAWSQASEPVTIGAEAQEQPVLAVYAEVESPNSQAEVFVRILVSNVFWHFPEDFLEVTNAVVESAFLDPGGRRGEAVIRPIAPGEVTVQFRENVYPNGNSASNVLRFEHRPSEAEEPSWGGRYRLAQGPGYDEGLHRSPRIAQDGLGTWLTIWESGITLCDELGGTSNILYSRSDDNGATWAPPAPIHPEHAAQVDGGDRMPEIAASGNGIWMAAWKSSKVAVDSALGDGAGVVSRSTDHGLTWSKPFPLGTAKLEGVDRADAPHIIHAGGSVWVVIWTRTSPVDGESTEIVSARTVDDGETWSHPELIVSQVESEYFVHRQSPRLAGDGAGNLVAAWIARDIQPGFSYTSRRSMSAYSNDWGATWSTETLISHERLFLPQSDAIPDIRIDTDGNGLWAATFIGHWNPEAIATHTMVSRSSDNGRTWSSSRPISNVSTVRTAYGQESRIRILPDGRWLAAWRTTDMFGFSTALQDVVFAVSDDGGLTWTDSRFHAVSTDFVVPNAESYGSDLDLAVGPDGRLVVVWASLLADDLEEMVPGAQQVFYSTSPGIPPSRPTVILESQAPDPVLSDFFEVTATFSETVGEFALENIQLANGIASDLEHCGAVYTFRVAPVSRGFVAVAIPENAAQSGAWQGNLKSATLTRTVLPPILPAATSIAPSVESPTNETELTFSVAFNRPVTGFEGAGNLVVEHDGTSHEGVIIQGGPRFYTVVLQGVGGEGRVSLAIQLDSGIYDLEGLALASSVTSAPVEIDTVRPVATILAPRTHFNGPAALSVEVSEPVSGTLNEESLVLVNAAFQGVDKTGNNYGLLVAPLEEGPFSVGIAEGAFQDAAGNDNPPSDVFEGMYDVTPPQFFGVAARPLLARPGETVSLMFATSEILATAPVVLVNGEPAGTPKSKGEGLSGLLYATDSLAPLGPVAVQIIGTDLAGNTGVYEDPALFNIVAEGTPLPLGRAAFYALVLALPVLLLRRRRRS